MKTKRTLTTAEVKQALTEFLYERGIVPEEVDPKTLDFKYDAWAGGKSIDVDVTYSETVLALTDS